MTRLKYPNALKALKENGSAYLEFNMDAERSFLSVTIPVHPYFAPKNKVSKKEIDYKKRIKVALGQNSFSRNELAAAMGYKGISAKLSETVDNMIENGELENVVVGTRVKIRIKK